MYMAAGYKLTNKRVRREWCCCFEYAMLNLVINSWIWVTTDATNLYVFSILLVFHQYCNTTYTPFCCRFTGTLRTSYAHTQTQLPQLTTALPKIREQPNSHAIKSLESSFSITVLPPLSLFLVCYKFTGWRAAQCKDTVCFSCFLCN